MTSRWRRRAVTASVGLLLVPAGCAATPAATPVQAPAAPVSSPPSGPEGAATSDAFPVPASLGHVHGLGKDPRDGVLLLAGHSGLYRAGAAGFERVGPALDLMGFTVAGPGHYYASGHPQPGSDLPQPMGLVESRDAGRSWQVVSRGGESDFHALTVAAGGVIGHDGALRRSPDARTWVEVTDDLEPLALAGRVRDPHVVAGTATTVVSSADAGRTWSAVPGSPAPALVSRAEDVVVAVTGDGRIHLGDATGAGWRSTSLVAAGPMALLATGAADDLEVVVLTHRGLVVSRAGAAFVGWSPDA